MDDLVSIIIAKRWPEDAEVRLAEDSLVSQDYRSLELLVCEDRKKRGLNVARNVGWRRAQGEYLLFSDPSCLWKSWAIGTLVDVLRRDPAASYAYCAYWSENADQTGRIVGMGPFEPWQVRERSCFSAMSLFRAANFPGFDESVDESQDWNLYRTLLERDGRLGACVPAVLFRMPAQPSLPSFPIRANFGQSVLCTFSGKYGDMFWSLASARELARRGFVVDFAVMPRFAAALELIFAQPYIRRAFAIDGWEMAHDGCAAQPWNPPSVPAGHDHVLHFTYRARPQVPLILYPGTLYGFPLSEPVLPFIEVADEPPRPNVVACGFNEMHHEAKEAFLAKLRVRFPNLVFEDVSVLPFLAAAKAIKSASMFLGDRNANFVLANGVAQRCLTFEPETGRREVIFSCPFGVEVMPEVADFDSFVTTIKSWTLCD